ncbi:MAG: arsenosugar biosynthesis radical SAM (seleno)protein ArsS [Thermodesulfobacteriota bacterium]
MKNPTPIPFPPRVTHFPDLRRSGLTTLQVNLGYRCNQRCIHCHVEAGPHRTEMMSWPVIAQVIDFLASSTTKTIDLTGGAPELNPYFKDLVHTAREMGVHVIDRCNLTILEEPGQEGLIEFLAAHQVQIIASLPCYLKENVDRQRGKGVFDKSIRVLKKLNRVGYGREGSTLLLNLVYNPQGPFLSPQQASLEADYKRVLWEQYGILFNQLYTLQNMPVGRFGKMLATDGEFQNYMNLLQNRYGETNLDSVMCRFMISVDWQGYAYDCDFNQMLGIPLYFHRKHRVQLSELKRVDLRENPIKVSDHCFGCTAGQGSSCGGALNQRRG